MQQTDYRTIYNIINHSYLEQLRAISNPPWMKELQLISRTMKSHYARLFVQNYVFSKTTKTVSINVRTINTKNNNWGPYKYNSSIEYH